MVAEATSIAQGIHTTDVCARYDNACKRLLAEKQILARIMKESLEEYQDCDVNDIAEKYIEGNPEVSHIPVMPDEGGSLITGMDTVDKTIHEGTITYDILFYALVPDSLDTHLLINIEAQNDYYPGYPLLKRGMYYASRLISSQRGREFDDSHYEKIKKVYSIWICLHPPKHITNKISVFQMDEKLLTKGEKELREHYDLIAIVRLCLGNAREKKCPEILRILNVLFSDSIHEAEKRRVLDAYGITMTKKIDKEADDMCNFSKGILEKGIAKGRSQGLIEGITNSIEKLIKNMGMTVEQAMTALEIPEAERPTYRNLLDQQ